MNEPPPAPLAPLELPPLPPLLDPLLLLPPDQLGCMLMDAGSACMGLAGASAGASGT